VIFNAIQCTWYRTSKPEFWTIGEVSFRPRYEDFEVERMNPTEPEEPEESAESVELFLLIWPAGSDLFLFGSSVKVTYSDRFLRLPGNVKVWISNYSVVLSSAS